MSRYRLLDPGPFEEVVFGWDEHTGFFLQCFVTSPDDDEDDGDGPAVWLPSLSAIELREALAGLELELSDLALRALAAEACGVSVFLGRGDPALWRGTPSSPPTPCVVVDDLGRLVRVRLPDGQERECAWGELEPDFARAGFEQG